MKGKGERSKHLEFVVTEEHQSGTSLPTGKSRETGMYAELA